MYFIPFEQHNAQFAFLQKPADHRVTLHREDHGFFVLDELEVVNIDTACTRVPMLFQSDNRTDRPVFSQIAH